jgi:tetratricopeptide (TPR) repeat protein
MDPITRAVVAALEIGGPGSSQKPVLEAYQTLRIALQQKFGPESDLMNAVSALEKKPESGGRQVVLHEEVVATRADQDPYLLDLAQKLLKKANQCKQAFLPPLQRPARVEKFVGRREEVARLLASLQPGAIVVLTGPGGVGKSSLAAELVGQLTPADIPPELFPNGIVYHNFYSQPRVDIALEQIARLFGEVPSPTPYDAVERALAGRQALLVLDGAEQADDLSGLLAVKGNCGVLLTSRQRHSGVSEQFEVAPLPLDQAVALLQSWKVMRPAEQVAAQVICELIGRLPLAIELIKHYLAHHKEAAADYVEWLQTTPLTDLTPLQRLDQSVALILDHSLAQLDETARHALAVVGMLALEPFDKDVVVGTLTLKPNQGLLSTLRGIFKQKADEKMPDVSQAIRELVNYGLLRPVGKRYQVSHPLIHTYARQHLTVPAQSIRQLAAYYVALAWEQSSLGPEGYARLDADRPHLMKVLSTCVERQDWEAAHGLAVAIEDYLDRQGYWAERVIANEVGLMASWQLGRPSEGAWLGNLGDTYRIMGHTKWAIEHFEKALATARQTGNLHSQGNALGNLGLAYRDLGQLDQARAYLEQALPIFEKIRSPSADMVRDWLKEMDSEASAG